jgi:predicted dehydrogenase
LPERLLICGAGRVVERYYAPALRRGNAFSVAGVVDPSPERRRWAAAGLHCPTYATLEEALASVACDAALVTTPPATQAELAVQLLKHRLPVLIEKPGARSIGEAGRVLEAAAGLPVRLALSRRYWPRYQGLGAEVKGDVRHWSIEIETDAAAWGHYDMTQATGLDGLIDDLLPHAYDIATSVLGVALEAEEVAWGDRSLAIRAGGESPGEIGISHGSRWHESVRGQARQGPFEVTSGQSRSLAGLAMAGLSRLSRRPAEPVEAIELLLESFAADLNDRSANPDFLRYATFSEQVRSLLPTDLPRAPTHG